MNDTEELLLAGMERFTADVDAPPAGLAGRAARHRRRRRIATAAATAGTVAAAAAVIAAVAVAGPAGSATQDAQTAAYVISRTESALAATSSQNLVENERITTSGGIRMVVTDGWATFVQGPGQSSTSTHLTGWAYRHDAKFASYTDSGQLTGVSGLQTSGQRVTDMAVSYQDKTWWAFTAPVQTPPKMQTCLAARFAGMQNFLGPTDDLTAALRTALRCGQYELVGTQRVAGVAALELTPVPSNEAYAHVTFWVDPSSYLPLRSVSTLGHQPGAVSIDYRWLKPTTANVAELHVSIPPGFSQVPVPGYLRR